MAINFPTSPTAGQVYTYNGVTYVYTAQGVWATAGASAVANVSQVGFRAHKNGVDQSGIPDSVFTKVTFGTEDYDQGGYYDTATSRWIPPAGLIHIDSALYISGLTAANVSFTMIYKNGVELKRATTTEGYTFDGFQISLDDVASGTDYYEAYVWLRGSPIVSGLVTHSFFNGHVAGGPPGPVGPSGSVTGAPSAPQGRLTLQTATPVMTTTQAAKTTIYYTPYVGNRVPIYDGSSMTMTTFAELSVATTDTTKSPAAIGASKVNDWFVWNDAGTVRLGHGPDWTSDTARSAGTALVLVNGLWLNDAAITNGPAASRGTYVGTTRSNASSQLDWNIGGLAVNGGSALLNVWNAYNRVNVQAFVGESSASWTYAIGTWAPANANQNTTGGNRISWVVGLPEEAMFATHTQYPVTSASNAVAGIGYDSNTAIDAQCCVGVCGTAFNGVVATCSRVSGLGAHFFQALHRLQGTSGACTWGGTLTAGMFQTGMTLVSRM